MSNAFTRVMGKPVPQTEQADPRQVQNNAGGFTFKIDDKARLERFLILGTDGGTYYVNEQKLTKDNIKFLVDLIERDEQLVIDTITEVSTSGRAYRNSPAIFALAAVFAHGKVKPTSALLSVCRTSTHLFEFAEYVQLFGGWGPSKRRAVAAWYEDKSAEQLAYQVVKYRQRNGWTHRDLFRLVHPSTSLVDNRLGAFILGKYKPLGILPIIDGFLAVQEAPSAAHVLSILDEFPNLPWETIPTQFHKDPEIWKKLFYNGALSGQALLRNVTRLARIGAFNDMKFEGDYAAKLVDTEMMKRTRLHPIQYLLAHSVHTQGQLNRTSGGYGSAHYRSKDWQTSSRIASALNDGFYQAFNYVEPAGKRTLIGLDVSGSMSSNVCGVDLSAAEMVAAMSMTIARTEPYYKVMEFANDFRDLNINPSMNLDQILNITRHMNFGSTDCALPMRYARKSNIAVDTFIVMTDNETWAGHTHPHVELKNYRQQMGIDAKLVVVAATPTEFSIADPTDRGMLDICGADTNLPSLVANFSAGRI